jgi:cytochrome c oxidase subunit II
MTDGRPGAERHPIIAFSAAVPGAVLVGCGGAVSALAPAGQAAADIAWITWIMLAGTLLLMVLMSGLWLHASCRRKAEPLRWPERSILIGGGLLLPLAVILLLLVYGVRSGQAMLPVGTPDLVVRAIGHQWWWQFEYTGPDGQVVQTDALHLPVDARVDVLVESADVIHSFWVPSLGGKLDAIPGRTNRLRLVPTRTGQFDGQCAEFCGARHAHMRFEVTVHEAGAFEDWLADAAAAAGDGRSGGSAP